MLRSKSALTLHARAHSTGKVFDVSPKREMYSPGKGYHIFAGKDGSRGLGMSSLKPEDAVSDYSTLDDKQLKVLDDWVRYSWSRGMDDPRSLRLTHANFALLSTFTPVAGRILHKVSETNGRMRWMFELTTIPPLLLRRYVGTPHLRSSTLTPPLELTHTSTPSPSHPPQNIVGVVSE